MKFISKNFRALVNKNGFTIMLRYNGGKSSIAKISIDTQLGLFVTITIFNKFWSFTSW